MTYLRKLVFFAMIMLQTESANTMDLLQTYELALARDPVYHAAEANRNAILEIKPQSIAQLLPTIAFVGTLNRNALKVLATPIVLQRNQNVGFWDSTMTLQMTQPIYRHELWVQLSQADNEVAAAEARFAAEGQNVALRTATAYFDVLLAEANLSFEQAEMTATEQQYEQAKARFDVGLIAITDVKVAEAAFDAVKARVIAAERDVENAKEALKKIIGEYSADLAQLRASIPFDHPHPDNIERWYELGQQNNLLITVASNQAELAKKGIDLQFAGHMPRLDMIGTAEFIDTARPNGISTQGQSIGAQLTVPIFEGGGVNARVDRARFEFEAANEQLDVQRRVVKLEVKNSFRNVIASIGQVQALRTAIASSQVALEAEQAGFEVGTRTMVDVLVVLRNLYANKRDYARAVYDYIVNSLTLKHAASLLGREDIEVVNRWLTAAGTEAPIPAEAATMVPPIESSKMPHSEDGPAADGTRPKPKKNGRARL